MTRKVFGKTKSFIMALVACALLLAIVSVNLLTVNAASAEASKSGNTGTVKYTGDYYYNPKYVSVFLYNSSGAAIASASNSGSSCSSVSATKSANGTHSVYGIGYETDYITGEVVAYERSNRAY